jgi:tetratricopeptide (TPR) repeat protein
MRIRWFWSLVCCAILHFTPLHAQSSVPALNDAGWKMIQQGEPARAASLFGEALVLRPDDPVLLFGAGVAAHLDGRSSDAQARLRRVLEVDPRFTPASLLLGEIVYREGDVERAVAMYETALTFAPMDRDLNARLREWRREADVHSTFSERQQGRFSVMFEGRTDAALAAHATQSLNTAFARIAKQLRESPPAPIAVILYTDKQFRDITRAPVWSSGLYDGSRIRIPVAGAARTPALFDVVLTHELAHAMVASIAPKGVPTWLHEGLAQYFSGVDPEAARRRLAARGTFISLEDLEQSFTDLGGADAVTAYDESLVAVHGLAQRPNVNWGQLLRALAETDTPSDALRRFGVSYVDLDAEFNR